MKREIPTFFKTRNLTMTDINDTNEVDDAIKSGSVSNRLDILKLLLKWRRFILINLVAVTIGAVIISFVLPRWYKATASILPPKEGGALNPLGAAGALLRGVGSSLPKIGTSLSSSGAYNYLAILNSRSVREAVVRKFDLLSVYGISDTSMDLALKELDANAAFEIQNEDYITIEVNDKDPQRAADMANYFVDMLNTVSIRLGTQEARSNREFIEQRVTTIYEDLYRAEDTLRAFQEKSPVLVSTDADVSRQSGVAELYGMKAKKEIEVGVLERTVASDNPVLSQYRIELNEIDKKVAQIPEAGLGSLRLSREVMIQQKILEYVLPLLEQAKVDEQKNIPVTLVLDKAMKPEHKDRPRRSLIVVIASLSSILLSIAYALMAEKLLEFKRKDPKRHALLLSLFRGWTTR